MVAVLKLLEPVAGWISRAALLLAGLGVVAMTVLVFWSIVGRYVFNDTPTWTEPAVLLLMSWFILLGSAVGVRERSHIGFEIGLAAAPPPLRLAMKVVTEALLVGFGVAMVVYGAQLAAGTWSSLTPMLGISQGWDYVPVAAGGALIVLFSVERLLMILTGTDDTASLDHGTGEI
ncbi:MAG: TRAP transporter small permease [Phreatobacter sp.]|uniref:TRAP transporter small permease n=1 Tax=Phreatobacter sp. TaxID=1966341 RepID=UPI001A57F511|nr:TRAP transporter small permease [Phreatobacter sp.]MBL8571461.1 TRAP transporter small permease [Phreatobacter sp.]